MSCGVGLRCNMDPALLRLWHRPVAVALIRPLAWEPPCAMGVAPIRQKKTKKEKNYKDSAVVVYAAVTFSFLLLYSMPLSEYTTVYRFTVDRYLGCFQSLLV